MNVEILVNRLRLYASHGVLPQERVVGANFYVTLTATVQVSDDALLHDKLQGTVDYGQIVEVLKQEMKQPSSLLEHAATRMASRVLNDFPSILKVELLLEKESPPLGVQTEGVGVKLVLTK